MNTEITVRATANFRFATPKCSLYLREHFTTAGADAAQEHTLKVVCEGSDRAEAEAILRLVMESLVSALQGERS